MLLLMSATHTNMNILLQLVINLSLRGQPRLQVAPVILDQALAALLCTRAMTLTSHHHHWNKCLRGQGKCTELPESLQHRSKIQGECGEGPDSLMVNSLAKLFWHLDQTRRHFWIPFFCKPLPQAKRHFLYSLGKQKRLCMMPTIRR